MPLQTYMSVSLWMSVQTYMSESLWMSVPVSACVGGGVGDESSILPLPLERHLCRRRVPPRRRRLRACSLSALLVLSLAGE